MIVQLHNTIDSSCGKITRFDQSSDVLKCGSIKGLVGDLCFRCIRAR